MKEEMVTLSSKWKIERTSQIFNTGKCSVKETSPSLTMLIGKK